MHRIRPWLLIGSYREALNQNCLRPTVSARCCIWPRQYDRQASRADWLIIAHPTDPARASSCYTERMQPRLAKLSNQRVQPSFHHTFS